MSLDRKTFAALLSLSAAYFTLGTGSLAVIGLLPPMAADLATSPAAIANLLTVFALTCVAWVFFRAHTVDDAFYVLTHFWRDWDFGSIRTEQFLLRQLPVAVMSIVTLEAIEWLHRRVPVATFVAQRPLVVRWSAYTAFILGVILFGIHRESQFIYFQF